MQLTIVSPACLSLPPLHPTPHSPWVSLGHKAAHLHRAKESEMAAATQENRSKLNYNFNSPQIIWQRGDEQKTQKWKTKRKYKITTINHCALALAVAWLQLQLTFSICQLPASYANLPRPTFIPSLSLSLSLSRGARSNNPSTI